MGAQKTNQASLIPAQNKKPMSLSRSPEASEEETKAELNTCAALYDSLANTNKSAEGDVLDDR